MATGRITLVAHTHWDREWYQPFEVFRTRLLEVVDEAVDLLERDPRLTFTLDGQVALVEDYLEMRPGMAPRLRALVQAGRLHIGPWFTQADTLMVAGEALIRNLAYGIRHAEALGGAMRLGYMPDQFGHAAQVPQLLRLFGIDSAVLWRGIGPERPPHAFVWVAPDGSEVTAVWLQEGYATGRHFPSDPASFAAAVERTLERHGAWLGEAPLLLPIGDDHVRLPAWLPEAADALRARRPEIVVALGGYADHLGHLDRSKIVHRIEGELRSPAFAPVLAGVASARIREKQAAARATTLLLRYAEPLCAWAVLGGVAPPRELLERAWRQLLLNQAHDSAAGCGGDATHEDVRGRYRWAEQITNTVCDQVLAALAPRWGALEAAPQVMVYSPGPRAEALVVEAEIPRSLEGPLLAFGPDGVERPVQPLSALEERPLFEGEFSAAELTVFVQGMDPATPLFGRYLTRLSAQGDGPGRVRLDVGMGDMPVPPAQMAQDQRRVMDLLPTAERFRIVIHGSGTTRRVLLAAGPALDMGLLPIWVRAAAAAEAAPAAAETAPGGVALGGVRVTPQPDGTVLIEDPESGLGPVIANDLVDEGDRGDLYHFDATEGGAVRGRGARTTVLEVGPLRARLRIEQDFDLPMGLQADRKLRLATTRTTTVTTEVTLLASARRVEFVTTFNNEVADHRLRALFRAPFRADRIEVDHGLMVGDRPLDTSVLGAGVERAALTGPHHLFVDVTDGQRGAALMTRGLPEHEVLRPDADSTVLALTLLRGVGWLARGDLSVIDHAAGPMVPTPGAQELGEHCFEYALLLHRGGWEAGQVLSEAQRYAAPPRTFAPGQRAQVEAGRSLLEVAPAAAVLLAAYPSELGLVVRLLNAAPRETRATLRPAFVPRSVVVVDPLEQPLAGQEALLGVDRDVIQVSLRPWQIMTLLLRP